jgi:hypothetical protein
MGGGGVSEDLRLHFKPQSRTVLRELAMEAILEYNFNIIEVS